MALQLQQVSKRFGTVQALDEVTFEVPQGAVYGLIGPNGAGKTTAMRSILGIVQPDAGHVLWHGRPVAGLDIFRTFGYLPEERGLYPKMRVRDELLFFGRLHGLSDRRAREAIDAFVELLRMADIIDRRVEDLSKGNAQKVQFAAACLHNPALVILDEPFAGLDPVNVRLFKTAVLHQKAAGSTVLFSSHRMEHVEELCDGLCLIARGRVVLEGAVDTVRRSGGRRVLRLAWQEAEPEPDFWEQLRRRGASVRDLPHRVWEISWMEAQSDHLSGPALLDLARQAAGPDGTLRLFELTYPSLEDVYVERVGQEAVNGESASSVEVSAR